MLPARQRIGKIPVYRGQKAQAGEKPVLFFTGCRVYVAERRTI
jgi:hypothetical protein